MSLLEYSMRVAGRNASHLMGPGQVARPGTARQAGRNYRTGAESVSGGNTGTAAGSTPQMQQAIANQPGARSGVEQTWDSALDFMESPGLQYSVMGVGAAAAMVNGGMGIVGCAAAAGTTASAGAVALGAVGALIPIAAGVAAGFAGHWIGTKIGDGIGAMLGLEPLSGPSEKPACVGDKIYHARSGLVAALMGAAVVLGAVAAIGAGALLTAATGGAAAPLLVATVSFVAGGLVGGAAMGAAGSLGSQGEEKGEIRTGSPDVFFENKPVAHVSCFIDCDDHGMEKQCAQGSDTVYVNGFPLSRQGHKTTCDGTIQTGRDTVMLDMTTSADQLDIDGGWLNRLTRTAVVISDFLPFPRGRKPSHGGDAPPTPRGPKDPGKPPRFPRLSAAANALNNAFLRMEGDPVDVASGQVAEFRTDITIPGTIDLRLDRSYRRGATGIQGQDWSGTWAQHLRLEQGAVVWQDPDGVQFTFDTPEDNVWSVNLRCPHIALMGSRNDWLYLYDYRSQLFTIFAHRAGRHLLLSAIQDRNGNEITFGWGPEGLSSVRHSDGFGLIVDSRGMLIRHAALTGHDAGDCVFTWQYDEAGRLVRVDSSQTGQLHYGYDPQGRLAMWSDSHLTRAHFAYDQNDRVIRNWTDSGHLSVDLAYDLTARRTRVIDAAGAVKLFDWTDRGLVWRETDAAGGEWLTEWGPGAEVLSRQDPLGNIWRYDHDGVGNLIRATDPEGNSESWEYGPDRLPTAHVDANGGRTSFRHDQNGNLIAITDPTGAQHLFRRDGQGKILRIDQPQARQMRIYYDGLNRPARVQTPSGQSIRLTHDTEGRMVSQTDEIGATTLMDYSRSPHNPRGALASVTLPDGTVINASYDSEGLLSAASNGTGDTRSFRHGAFDLPLETQDPQGNRVRLEHDFALRVTAVVNEMGERHELAYDAVGNLVAERDYSGLVTRYEHDAAGRLVQRIAPDGARTRYEWSPAGRLLQTVVTDGQQVLTTRSTYDPAGRLIAIEDDNSQITRRFDAAGRLVSETVNGRETRFDFRPGESSPILRGGDGLQIEFDHNPDGQVLAMRFAGTELRFEHDMRGLETLRHSPAGFSHQQGWDVMRRLTGQLAGPGLMRDGPGAARIQRGYHWDRAGRVVAIDDRSAGLTRMRYDARGLVTNTSQQRPDSPTPLLRRFDYDPSRNLAGLIEDMRAEQVETHAGRVRRRGRITYQHDDCGRVIQKRLEEPGFRPRIWAMVWDAQDRLVRLTAPDGSVWRYDYDALGRRIHRLRVIEGGRPERDPDDWGLPSPPRPQTGDPMRMGSAYQWDGDRIIAEAPVYADGTVAWDQAEHWVYDPDSFRPLARVHQGHIAHVVTDHLGTPRELVSDDGTRVLWRAELNLWGGVDRIRQAANDDHPPVGCPIRFQGQWADPESGLHYNRHRYYDPDATQYLTPDPIGLLGGIRPQGYVDDPNGWVDPLGLARCAVRDVNGTKIYGTGQKDKTPGHNQLSEVIANRLAMSGLFDRIYMNRAYSTAAQPDGYSGVSTRRPDVLAVGHDGKYYSIEIASKSDMINQDTFNYLTLRNEAAQKTLPMDARNLNILSFPYPWSAADIHNALNSLIGGM